VLRCPGEVELFEVLDESPRRAEAADDQGSLETAADGLDVLRVRRVSHSAADCIVEDPHHVTEIVFDSFTAEWAAIEDVQQAQVAGQSEPLDDDVQIVQVAVVFPLSMDVGNASGERLQKVQTLEGV
jgi:hypothetical protein